MKKKILLIITIIILCCACSKKYFNNINLKTLNQKLDNKESFVLYLTNDDDGKVLKNTLKKVLNNKEVNGYYLNTIKLNDKELDELKEIFTFEDTNIILFIKDGKEETVLSRIDDLYISEANLEQELINQGYIK